MSEKKKSHSMIRSRFWWVTANPTKEDKPAVPPPEFDSEALHYQLTIEHVGEKSGLNHYHGLLHFKDSVTMSIVKMYWRMSWLHCEVLKDCAGAEAYCKDGHTAVGEPVEHGTPVTSGHRSDIQAALSAIRSGHSAAQVRLDNPSLYRLYKAIDQMERDVIVRPPFMLGRRAAIILWGPPDMGKTCRFKTTYGLENVFVVSMKDPDLHKFDGYRYEDNILMEDIKPEIHCMDYLKELITTDHREIDCRYAPKPRAWRRVLFTSNTNPDEWWPYAPDRQKFFSRITHIEWIGSMEQPSELFPYKYDPRLDEQVPII